MARVRGHLRGLWIVAAIFAMAAVLFAAGGLGLLDRRSPSSATGSGPTASGLAGVDAASSVRGAAAGSIAGLQARLRRVPGDFVAWASLGLAYVDQARVTGDPTYYPKAEGALARSLALDTDDNFVAAAGMAALSSGRHDFAGARQWAERGLAINPSNSTLYGALGDAETQLGHYPEAFDAIQRMVDLAPGTASLSRTSYAWELRGDLDRATAAMRRALDEAGTGSDRAFARYYLGELAFNAGDASTALDHHEAGMRADPGFAPLLEGKARAEAALGRVDSAVADYAKLVERMPQPGYLLEYGELLQSLNRQVEADEQYRVFRAESALFASNGVNLDVDAVLFEADHGNAAEAVRLAEAAVLTRPFLDMQDAYAWALHVAGRDGEAMEWSVKAQSLGTRNALFSYHAGMIELSLGDVGAARRDLGAALALNPRFSSLGAPLARQALDRIGDG